MTEAQLTNKIIAAIREHDPAAWIFKTHGSGYQRAGVPDLLICISGMMIAIEVKRPGGKVTRLQQREIERLRVAGATAAVARSVNEALEICTHAAR